MENKTIDLGTNPSENSLEVTKVCSAISLQEFISSYQVCENELGEDYSSTSNKCRSEESSAQNNFNEDQRSFFQCHDYCKYEEMTVEINNDIRCRTCLSITQNYLGTKVTEKLNETTVKEALLRVVPELKMSLMEEDFICNKCLIMLNTTMTFIKRCLEVEELLRTEVEDGEGTSVNLLANEKIEDFNSDGVITKEPSIVSTIIEAQDVNLATYEICNCQENCICGKFQSTEKLPIDDIVVEGHNYVVSTKKLSDNVALDFIKQYQNQTDLELFYHKNAETLENKRILLFGTVDTKMQKTKCTICTEIFSTDIQFNKHCEEKHSDIPKEYILKPITIIRNGQSLSCEICDKTLATYASKGSHAKNCRMFNCPYCNEPFNASNLSAHTSSKHNDSEPFKCFNCKQQFTQYSNYRRHICASCMCDKCGSQLNNWIKLCRHRRKCHTEIEKRRRNARNSFVRFCQSCNEWFDKIGYQEHLELKHKPYVCSYKKCIKRFMSSTALEQHRYKYHQQKLCPVCGDLVLDLNAHFRKHKKGHRQYECQECHKSYYFAFYLKKHQKDCHGEKSVCEICGKKFAKNSLSSHIKLQHKKGETFICSICQTGFSRKDYLKRHMATCDPNIQQKNPKRAFIRARNKKFIGPLSCTVCKKLFNNLSALKVHIATHVESFRYKCRYCGVWLRGISNRCRHEQRHRSNPLYKFRCNTCWKIFSNEDELRLHETIHDNKKYVCETCGEGFSRKYLLNNHDVEFHISREQIMEERNLLWKIVVDDLSGVIEDHLIPTVGEEVHLECLETNPVVIEKIDGTPIS